MPQSAVRPPPTSVPDGPGGAAGRVSGSSAAGSRRVGRGRVVGRGASRRAAGGGASDPSAWASGAVRGLGGRGARRRAGSTGGTCAGTPGSGVFGAGGAGVSPTVTGPLTEPVTGANPLRSGSSAARLQLTLRVPAFQDSSVRLSQ